METFLHKFLGIKKNINQRVKRYSDLCLFGIAILALLALSGCAAMVLPSENMRWDMNAPVFFAGGVKDPGVKITIQAWGWDNWYDIGSFKSESNKWQGLGADYAYLWYGWLPIDAKYWGNEDTVAGYCAQIGHSADVRAKLENGSNLFAGTVWDWPSCYWNHPGSDFYKYCWSDPGAGIDTMVRATDYHHFGKECVAAINALRKKEGKPLLQMYEWGNCEADENAKYNYQYHLTHPTENWHQHQPGGAAQNGCPKYPTYDSLFSCIALWDDKPYGNNPGEKTCFQKNPLPDDTNDHRCAINVQSLPYYCYGSNCECGHYVNMINCPVYTKVSCGIYKAPDGNWAAVANFYQ